MEIRNSSENVFTDISSEEWRLYEFESGAKILIKSPTHLSVSKIGGHRLLDEDGISHYVPATWIHIAWKAKDDKPHFVK
jgi:hypothetical protein